MPNASFAAAAEGLPGTIFLPYTRPLRRRLEATVDHLLALLDALDGDADLEADNDDEPSLGWRGEGRASPAELAGADREAEDEHDEDGGDREADGDDLEADANGEAFL